MNLNQIFLILRARYKLMLFAMVTTVISAIAVAWTMPPRYKATTSLVVDFKIVDPITGMFLPVQLLQASYMATEVDILESHTVALKVVKALRLAESEEAKQRFQESTNGKGTIQDWLGANLQGGLKITPSKESRVIEVNFTNTDPELWRMPSLRPISKPTLK